MEPTIVVPLIGSVESVDALQSARAVARITGGHLVLLGAMPRRHPHVSRTDEVHTRRELESLARIRPNLIYISWLLSFYAVINYCIKDS